MHERLAWQVAAVWSAVVWSAAVWSANSFAHTYSPRVSTLLPAGPANTTESPSWNTRYWRQNRMFSIRSKSL